MKKIFGSAFLSAVLLLVQIFIPFHTALGMDTKDNLKKLPQIIVPQNITYQKYVSKQDEALSAGGQNTVTPLSTAKVNALQNENEPQVPAASKTLRTTFVSGSEIDLAWNYDYYNDGSISFNVYRSESSSGPFTLVGTTVSNAYYDRNVSSSKNYWYYVRSSNINGEGSPSNTINVLTTADITLDKAVAYSIADPNHENLLNTDGVRFTYKYMYQNNTYSYYTYNITPSIEKTLNGWTIKLNNFDWKSSKEYRVVINTSKYLFHAKIDQTKVGTNTSLTPDDTYTTVGADVKYAASLFGIKGIQINIRDENGVSFGGAYLKSQTMVPSGKYDFIVMANDSQNSYYLIKTGFDLSKTTNTMIFERQDAGLINLNMHDSSTYQMRSNYFYGFGGNLSIYWGIDIPSNVNSIYVTKMNYNGYQMWTMNNSNWEYCYSYDHPINVVDDSTVANFGTNFKVELLDNGYNYYPGETCYDLSVKDEYGNQIRDVYAPNGQYPTGTIEFTDNNGAKTTINIENIGQSWFTMPQVEGVYYMTYTVNGMQYPVTPLPSTKITVSYNGTPQLPAASQNLRATFVSGSEVDLAWDYNDYNNGTTHFNIYRAESSDGQFTLAGTSYSNAYYDRNVKPSADYWYYVKAVNGFGEGDSTSTINLSTTPDVTTDSSVTLSIEDTNHEITINPSETRLLFKNIYGENNYNYIYTYDVTPSIEKSQNGWTIKYNGFNWNQAKEYRVFVNTSKYIFQTKIDQTKMGTIIPLAADETYTTVGASINYAGSGLNMQGIQVIFRDENGVAIGSAYLQNQTMIPSGKYDFVVLAQSSENSFFLMKKDFQLTKTSNIIGFDRLDAGKLNLNMHDSTGLNMRQNYFWATASDLYSYSGVYMPSNVNTVYMSKMNYNGFQIWASNSSGWEYNYFVEKSINIVDDTSVLNFGTTFKAGIRDNRSIFIKGQTCYDLEIRDEYNNLVRSIMPNGGARPTGIVEITDESGVKTTININDVSNPWFKMPDTPGTYYISFTLSGMQYPVEPLLPTKITVVNNGGSQLPQTPQNLRTEFVSGSEVDLAWDGYTDDTTIFNIYRAESSDGPFTLVGSSASFAYFDRNISPSTSYWYYVKAANDNGESSPSNTINITTTGDITPDKSITLKVQDPNHELSMSPGGIQVMCKETLGDGSYHYIKAFGGIQYIEKNQDGWAVKYNNVNWNVSKEYKVFVNTKKYLFEASIDQTKEGTIIPLAADDTYVPLQANISFAGGNLVIHGIEINYLDENNIPINVGIIKPGILIQSGRYEFLVSATDDNYSYFLAKQNYTLGKENNVLTFSANDAGKIKINLNNTTDKEIKPAGLFGYCSNFEFYLGVPLNNNSKIFDSVYVSKSSYYGIKVAFSTNDGWNFGLAPAAPVNIQDDSTVLNFDTNLKGYINLDGQNYEPGQFIGSDHFMLTDGLNNRVAFMNSPDWQNNIVKIEFLDSKGTVVDTIIQSGSNFYQNIQLPYITGTYTVRYSIVGTPFNIAPVTSTITIGSTQQVQKDALNMAITDAEALITGRTVGTQPGNVPQTAMDAFKTAIDNAKAVRDNPNATQAEVDAQVTALAAATIAFNSAVIQAPAVDKAALNKAITDAEALITGRTVGTQPGNVPQSAKDAFQSVIDFAKIVYNDPNSTQTEIDAQVTALAAATIAFNNSVIISLNTIKCGDVNGDGAVDLNDALEIMYYKSHMNSKMNDNAKVNILNLNISDVNGDGAVDLSDSLEIKYYKAHMNSKMSEGALRRINTVIP